MSAPDGSIHQLGDFRLTRKLGEGGMGAVFKARQLSMDRDVALKILPKHLAKDPSFVDRFYREARASARLDHPNIVRGISVGEDRGFHYFAMEFIDGESTDKFLDRQGRFAVGDALRITLDVAQALDHAHAKGMVHRDIKPDNIMITRDGHVKLADLGLTKTTDENSSLTQTGSGFGTPYYMAPEQARNAKYVDNRSDIYSLGATLYHLLTGKLPFEGETPLEVLTAKEEGGHVPARRHTSDVPEILDLILDKMMARDPRMRFQNASELTAALEKTELAAAMLSWVGNGPQRAAAPQAGPVAAKPRDAASGSGVGLTGGEQYFLRYKDRRGKLVNTTGTKHQVRDLIRKGGLSTDVQGARDLKGPYRPLLAFPEFAELMQSRFIKEKSDQAIGGMADKFAEYEKEDTHRKKMRRLKTLARRVITAVILVGIIAACLYFGWTLYLAR